MEFSPGGKKLFQKLKFGKALLDKKIPQSWEKRGTPPSLAHLFAWPAALLKGRQYGLYWEYADHDSSRKAD
jgi:hypothetical protein